MRTCSGARRLDRGWLGALHLTAVVFTVVLAGAFSPASAATNLFGLIDTGELYKSADQGATWSAVGAVPVRDAVGLAAGASSQELFMASRSGTIYRSTNGGGAWSAVGTVSASDVAGFTLSPFGNVLVLTRTGTVYSSGDHGATFSAVASLAGSDWTSLARGPLGRLYALTRTGQVVQSLDQGTSWATIGIITSSDAVSIRRLGAQLFVLASTGEVYKSIDYGVSWIPVGTLSQGSMSALADVGAQLVAAASEGEVAASSNGASWSWVGAINQLHVMALGTDAPQVTGVADDLSPPKALVAAAPFPNPRVGAGGATFRFTIGAPDRVRLELYDVQGRLRAARPFESIGTGGQHWIRWEPPSMAPGTYVVRFVTESGRLAAMKWTMVR